MINKFIAAILRRRGDTATTARERVLQRCAEIDPEDAAELEAVFGCDVWGVIEEIVAGPSIMAMTEDPATDLSILPPQVAAAIQLRRVGRKTDATAVLSGEISIAEALEIVAEAQTAVRSSKGA